MAALPLTQTCCGPVGAREAWKENDSKSGEDRVPGKSTLALISHGFLNVFYILTTSYNSPDL